MEQASERTKELVIAPGDYAYMQDVTKGVIKVSTGPCVINQTAQEVPVKFNPREGFKKCSTLEEAVRKNVLAVEGYYLVLFNPVKDSIEQPEEGLNGKAIDNRDLRVGRRVNIPGPVMFPLWPGQYAYSIRGHQLRSNQYLLVRVYNEEEARENWSKAIVKPAEGGEESEETAAVIADVPEDLTVGKQLVIKGTDVSFYIPPTGVSVVPENEKYVREALTLERLEYCVLVDEDGNKKFPRGPKVVFPEPTEQFYEKNGSRKFRAVELNPIQGIHLKAIAGYTENGVEYKEGDEIFITGKETAIYFPRQEHSLIKYDGQTKHFATAIPAGEGRYLLDRMTGAVDTIRGPAMLLPNPIEKVFIRRTLSAKQVDLWYPGNTAAQKYNAELRAMAQASPTTRSGAISDGDYERSRKKRKIRTTVLGDSALSVNYAAGASVDSEAVRSALAMDSARLGEADVQADEFSRKATYTEPRTVTLDTKFSGVPTIEVWTGYAVMVVSKTGKRRVEQGPCNILLDYDESLEVLELSTGKPKTTDDLYKTVYLRVKNNKVSDEVYLNTEDHVSLTIKLAYKVDFIGDPNKWFDVENYIKLLCDHIRSVLKAAVRKMRIADFYAKAPDIIRDVVLGIKDDEIGRTGMLFEENGMHVSDVDILSVEIDDEGIQEMMMTSQHQVVEGNIELANRKHNHELLVERENIARRAAEVKATTENHARVLQKEKVEAELDLALKQFAAELKSVAERMKTIEANESIADFKHGAELQRAKSSADQNLEIEGKKLEMLIRRVQTDSKAVVDKFNAAKEGFSDSLIALQEKDTLIKVAEAMSAQRLIGGQNLVDAIGGLFENTPLKETFNKLLSSGDTQIDPSDGGRKSKQRQ